MIRTCLLLLFLSLGLSTAGAPAAIRLLAVMPTSESFQEAKKGMQSELGKGYILKSLDIQVPKPHDTLLRAFREFAPDGLILMDAKAIALVKAMSLGDSALARIPKFVLMTLKAEDASRGLDNVAGIRFEVPAYTTFMNLKAVSKRDFRRIGVFYRKGFAGFIEESRRFLAKEKMELIGKCLDCEPGMEASQDMILKGLRMGMNELRARKVELVWMLADNLIVSKATLKGFWMTRFKESELPLVVPLENMVSLESDLGFFTAFPDYFQLGTQSAQQVIAVFESGRTAAGMGFEPLISVQMTLNADLARKAGWDLRDDKLSIVKKVLRRP